MRQAEPGPPNFNRWLQAMCDRPARPLTVAEQRRRYRRRKRLPDWAWGLVVGFLVSAAVVLAMWLAR